MSRHAETGQENYTYGDVTAWVLWHLPLACILRVGQDVQHSLLMRLQPSL